MISVIMLTYNRETMVSRAIESILGQHFQDFEFIIIDNGSTDGSGIIANQYAERDKRIRVCHCGKRTIGSARNIGLDMAKGDYIAFIDDDDFVEPVFLEYLHNLILEYKADIAICGSWREIEGVRVPKYIFDGIYTYGGEDAVYEMLRREKFNSAIPAKLISKQIFKSLRCNETGKYEDIEVTYKIVAEAKKVVVSGKPLYIHVRHGKNNSLGTTEGELVSPEQISDYLEVFSERTRWLSSVFPNKAAYWFYTELSYALSMYEKVKEEWMRQRLKEFLKKHIEELKSFERFYTERDWQLIKKYEEELLR